MRDQLSYYQEIIAFFEESETSYREGWDLDKSMALHAGYWDKGITSFGAAVTRLNELLVETIQIKASDSVLDAGCGVGGSAIYLAKNIGCKVEGITLLQKQVDKSMQNAAKHGVSHLIEFAVKDYMDPALPSEKYDVIWAIESFCYALDKNELARQMFRLLKPGGRLIVADYFEKRQPIDKREASQYRFFLDGFAVDNLVSDQAFVSDLDKAGFQDISNRSCLDHFSPNLTRLKILGVVSTTITTVLRMIGIKRKNNYKNIGGKVALYYVKFFSNGLLDYNIVAGHKPL